MTSRVVATVGFSTEQSTSLFDLLLRGARELERHLFKLIRGKMTADGGGCRRAEAGRHARERAARPLLPFGENQERQNSAAAPAVFALRHHITKE